MNQSRADATRADDERVLTALRLRDRGVWYEDIAHALGGSASYWRVVAQRVHRDYGRSESA